MARRERQLRVQPNENDSEVGGQSRAVKYVGSFKLRFLGFGSTFRKSRGRKPEELQDVTPAVHDRRGDRATQQQQLYAMGKNTEATEYASESFSVTLNDPSTVAAQCTVLPFPSEVQQQAAPTFTGHDETASEAAGDDEDGEIGRGSGDNIAPEFKEVEQQLSGVDCQAPDGALEFYPAEHEPVLNKDFRRRAVKAVRAAVHETDTLTRVTQSEKCCVNCIEFHPCACLGDASLPEFTPETKRASYMGFRMLKKLLFPAMPKVLRDLWVCAELGVTIFQFVFSVISLSLENDRAFNIVYLILSIISLILALIDGFIHFVQLGSCAECVRWCRSKRRGDSESDQESETVSGDKSNAQRKCWQFSPKWKNSISEWVEVVRNVLTELLIYPLLVCDLFDLIVGGSYLRSTTADRINFALFIVGGFYLFLSVYFMRIFMVVSSLFTLRRIPYDISGGQQRYINLITRFCIHILAQLVTHATIIITIGLKIRQENPQPCPDGATGCINASPFLIYAAIAGGVIPFFGVVTFFFVNYYQMRELSVSFWVDMLSLLQAEGFANLVFQGEGVKVAKQKATCLADNLKLQAVKEQLKDVQSVPKWVKVFYPVKNPILIILGVLYKVLIISFIVCLLFTRNSSGNIEFVLFDEQLSSGFFVVVVVLLMANYKVLILISSLVVYAPVSAIVQFFNLVRNYICTRSMQNTYT